MAIADFQLVLLSAEDGTWGKFRDNWQAQCDKAGEHFDDYSPDSLSVVAQIVAGTLLSAGTDDIRAAALFDGSTGEYHACCSLNLARLPGTDGVTLRVRHLIVSPAIDFGVSDVQMYPDVVIGMMLGIIDVASNVLPAEHIRFHLRSPEDKRFFHLLGTTLGNSGIFESVQTHGSWLYLTRATGGKPQVAEETK